MWWWVTHHGFAPPNPDPPRRAHFQCYVGDEELELRLVAAAVPDQDPLCARHPVRTALHAHLVSFLSTVTLQNVIIAFVQIKKPRPGEGQKLSRAAVGRISDAGSLPPEPQF